METIALWIGYIVMGATALAVTAFVLAGIALWWEWNVLLPRYTFDGKGNLVPINTP